MPLTSPQADKTQRTCPAEWPEEKKREVAENLLSWAKAAVEGDGDLCLDPFDILALDDIAINKPMMERKLILENMLMGVQSGVEWRVRELRLGPRDYDNMYFKGWPKLRNLVLGSDTAEKFFSKSLFPSDSELTAAFPQLEFLEYFNYSPDSWRQIPKAILKQVRSLQLHHFPATQLQELLTLTTTTLDCLSLDLDPSIPIGTQTYRHFSLKALTVHGSDPTHLIKLDMPSLTRLELYHVWASLTLGSGTAVTLLHVTETPDKAGPEFNILRQTPNLEGLSIEPPDATEENHPAYSGITVSKVSSRLQSDMVAPHLKMVTWDGSSVDKKLNELLQRRAERLEDTMGMGYSTNLYDYRVAVKRHTM